MPPNQFLSPGGDVKPMYFLFTPGDETRGIGIRSVVDTFGNTHITPGGAADGITVIVRGLYTFDHIKNYPSRSRWGV
jgi:hypothetical protein